MAVEAAKKRQRKRDVELMDRSFRQATARQKSGRATKARYGEVGRSQSLVSHCCPSPQMKVTNKLS